MKYTMTVTIADPETREGMISDIVMKLKCYFSHDENTYGNGYYLKLVGQQGFGGMIDLRYDQNFDRNNKEGYLKKWAHNYWSGKDGAYYVKDLIITKED